MNLHPKVQAGTLAGALVTMLVAAAAHWGYSISSDQAAALVTIISLIAGYFNPSGDHNG